MLESTSPYLQSEMAYRVNRIRNGVARGRGQRRTGGRVPRIRRPAETVERQR